MTLCQCTQTGVKMWEYNHDFDARYCIKCFSWIEEMCTASTCEPCIIRPQRAPPSSRWRLVPPGSSVEVGDMMWDKTWVEAPITYIGRTIPETAMVARRKM